MKIFCWNCRGLERPRTVRAQRESIRSLSPQVVCLLETKKMAKDLEGLKYRLGFQSVFGVNCRGRSGGIALLWKDSVVVEIRNYSFWHIDAVVKEKTEFRLSVFYGEPSISRRVNS
ncbi:unnamed protein product [Rhodiola kirilowii]